MLVTPIVAAFLAAEPRVALVGDEFLFAVLIRADLLFTPAFGGRVLVLLVVVDLRDIIARRIEQRIGIFGGREGVRVGQSSRGAASARSRSIAAKIGRALTRNAATAAYTRSCSSRRS